SEAERERLRAHLAMLVEQIYRGSLPGEERPHWWAGAHLHHDFWVPVGGYGEAALALLGEVADASRWAARTKLEFDICLSWLGEGDEPFDLRPGPKGVYQAPYERSSYRAERTEYPHPASQCVAWNVLWYDPSVPPQPPSAPPRSHHFPNQDVVILRSGWDDQ